MFLRFGKLAALAAGAGACAAPARKPVSRKPIALCGSAVLLALLSPASLMAQTSATPPPSPPDPASVAVTKAGAATISYLQKRFNLGQAEAEKRFGLQSEVAVLRSRLEKELASSFAGIRVQHSPEHRVIVQTTDVAGTTAQLGQVSAELRAVLQVASVSRNAADIRKQVDDLVGLLRPGRFAHSVRHDPTTGKFLVTVENQEALALAGTLIPATLRSDVNLTVGTVPKDAQAGYVSGDYTYGGWPLYNASGNFQCTSGYVVRLSDSRYGVTTAGHCAQSDRIWVNNKYVTLPSTTIQYNGGLYDYRVFLTGNLTISGTVAYKNNKAVRNFPNLVNSVYGYADSGYFRIKDGLYPVGAGYDDVVCKSGETTWLTCGQVSSTYHSYTSSAGISRTGMHLVDFFFERAPGYGGDSGGPVFREEPDGTIIPAGTLSGVHPGVNGGPCDTNVVTDCYITYMPIDRINDQQPMQIKTNGGTVNPS